MTDEKIEDLGISREDYAKAINECIFGKEEPASKDLEEEIKKIQRRYKTIEEYDGQYAPLYASDIEHIARHFAEWQKEKDQFQIDMAHDGGYMEGQEHARRQITEAKPLSNLRRALTHKFYEASKRNEVKEIGDPSEAQDIFDMVNNLDEICSYFGYKYDFEEGMYKLNEEYER